MVSLTCQKDPFPDDAPFERYGTRGYLPRSALAAYPESPCHATPAPPWRWSWIPCRTSIPISRSGRRSPSRTRRCRYACESALMSRKSVTTKPRVTLFLFTLPLPLRACGVLPERKEGRESDLSLFLSLSASHGYTHTHTGTCTHHSSATLVVGGMLLTRCFFCGGAPSSPLARYPRQQRSKLEQCL